jgi:hypothetical protein
MRTKDMQKAPHNKYVKCENAVVENQTRKLPVFGLGVSTPDLGCHKLGVPTKELYTEATGTNFGYPFYAAPVRVATIEQQAQRLPIVNPT